MITRKEYMMDSSRLFNDYHGQFVSQGLKNYVVTTIGPDRILNSRAPYFNDIPLVSWNRLQPVVKQYISRKMLTDLGESMSLSLVVCVAKTAARQWQQENRND